MLSTTWYYYNGVGNVTRAVTHPEGTDDYSATRLVYAVNGSAVSYVMGETWTWDGVAPCPDNYDITYVREFRYDGARQRYLNRELDAEQLQEYELLVSVSETWSDYDGDEIYGDFTVDGGTVTQARSFEPGIARSSAPANPLATEYYHHDNLGTTRLLTDEGAACVSPSTYTAFGELVDGENHRYGYAGAWGYQSDDALPYLHVGYRYYDSESGRFLQRDPIGIGGGANVYTYVGGTPTGVVDPTGQQYVKTAGGIWAPGTAMPMPGKPPFWRGLLPKLRGIGRASIIIACGLLARDVAEEIVVPAIDRHTARRARRGATRYGQPFDPDNPWGWVPPGSSWNRQRIQWEEEHRPKPKRRPDSGGPLPEVPCGPHY